MSKFWNTARKTVTALVTGVLGWVAIVIADTDPHIDAGEWYTLAVVVATALGVYAAANKPA